MSDHAQVIRDAVEYLFDRAELREIAQGLPQALIETSGQRVDALDALAALEAELAAAREREAT